jgi:hypothetical protein
MRNRLTVEDNPTPNTPGAFAIIEERSSQGYSNLRPSAGTLRPSGAMAPLPEASRLYEDEYKEELVSLSLEAEGNVHVNSRSMVNSPDYVVEASAVNDQEVYQLQAREQKKWHQVPFCRAIIVGNVLLILLLVVGIVVLVLFLTKTVGGTPTATPAPSLASEKIACDFIGQPSLTVCRNTLRVDIDSTFNGSTIPTEIGLLTQLTYLDFNLNDATAATIPSSISKLTLLTHLDFNRNGLQGTIPSSFSQLIRLTYLDFNRNELTGTIPSSIFQLTGLINLSFFNNNLVGTIPSSIVQLTLLTLFDVSVNGLTGMIPPAIFRLTLLTQLDLFDNNLTGTIPSSLCQHVPALYIDCGEIECTCCRTYDDSNCEGL